MNISYQKALYFFHRWLEGYDPERAIMKWNKGYPNDQATAAEIEEFLTQMVNRTQAGQKDAIALQEIVAGGKDFDLSQPRTGDPPEGGEPRVTEGKVVPLKKKTLKEKITGKG